MNEKSKVRYPDLNDVSEIDVKQYQDYKFMPVSSNNVDTQNINAIKKENIKNGLNMNINVNRTAKSQIDTNATVKSNLNIQNVQNSNLRNEGRFFMTTLQIKEIQSMLNRAGYGILVVDGIIGPRTKEAVMEFQRDNGLKVDGIIGPNTYMVMNNYLNGYARYKIRRGDTFYNLGKRYGIDYRLIEAANPNVNSNNLQVGTDIILPINISIVPTDMEYTYEMMLRNLRSLKVLYPFITLDRSGESSLGKGLYYFKVGNGNNNVFYNASHHGLEWITTPVLMKFSEDYVKNVVTGSQREVASFNFSTMTVMPMVNPDGVSLVLEGLKTDNPNYNELIRWNNNNSDFSRTWQANNNGVDINHNYNAKFEEYQKIALENGYGTPGPTRYPGPYAESEPETRGVVNLVNNNNFNLAIAYHTQGEVVYYKCGDIDVAKAEQIGTELANAAGYTLDEASGLSSYSGFKDWFILSKVRPGYTVEAGLGRNPLPISQFNEIYNDNKRLLQRGLERF